MLEDIGNHNNNYISNNNKKKTVLLVTGNIRYYQQQFNNYNINKYKITFVNWNDILSFITNFDDPKRKNLELIILDISTAAKDAKTNQISTSTIGEIKKIFYDTRIFFILPFESMIDNLLSIGICKQEDIRLQPFSVFDIIDLISITKKNERLDRLQLKDHCMYIYSSVDDKVKDAIKFLKIGIENNEMTLLLLSKEIEPSYLLCQIALHDIDISKLQNNGLLKIANTEEYYLSFNQKYNKINRVTVDNKKVHSNFFNLADQVNKREGINGLRIFAMLDCFFEHGLVDELVDYECETPFKFSKPILGICAYNDKHIAQLSEDQIRKLVLTHSSVWI